jgi:hypothetical protein
LVSRICRRRARRSGPQPPHHLWSWKRKEEIDRRPGGNGRIEHAAQLYRVAGDRPHGSGAARAIKDADAHEVSGRDLEDVPQMIGPPGPKRDRTRIVDFAAFQKN